MARPGLASHGRGPATRPPARHGLWARMLQFVWFVRFVWARGCEMWVCSTLSMAVKGQGEAWAPSFLSLFCPGIQHSNPLVSLVLSSAFRSSSSFLPLSCLCPLL